MIYYTVFVWKKMLKILLLSLFCTVCCISCNRHNDVAVKPLEISDTFMYWESTEESTVEDAEEHSRDFKRLEDKSTTNLRNILGKGEHYVWVRAEFTIPPAYRHQPLGLVIPYLRFAEKVYCNGTFISRFGDFPPNEHSTMFKAHFFSFPMDVLKQHETNTILIKIYAQGRSAISSHSVILPVRYAYPLFEVLNFYHTRVYLILIGILLLTFVLYLSFYLNLKQFKQYRDFAFLNFFTAIFLLPFVSTELPAYTNGLIPYVPFIKLTLCIPPYVIVYFSTMFVADFVNLKKSPKLEKFRLAILALQILLTIFAPTYEWLISSMPLMFGLILVQGFIGAYWVVKGLRAEKYRRRATELITGFMPFSISILVDIFLRLHDNTQVYPYFSIFCWHLSIVVFIIILSTQFSRVYRRNEYLTNHLQEEVDIRTRDLQGANYELSILTERLEKEKFRADLDLQMASIVQQRFFPEPNKHFKGWDLAVSYNSQAIVSGDLYDYYTENHLLNGLSLFDVSGHGISAGLVTMLSKNIISHAFHKGFAGKEPMDRILARINNIILNEKGEIDNYLTGLLCRFENDTDAELVHVELGNAGHPYPLKYSAATDEVTEITGNDGKKHYGAIGMQGIEISFATSRFDMADQDIMVWFTDGIIEASNKNQEQFGKERLKRIVKENCKKSSNDILKAITKEHWSFTEGKPLEDDITIIVAKRDRMSDYVSESNEDEQTDETELELLPVDE